MKLTIITLFLALSIALNAQKTVFNFKTFSSFNEIKATAQKENKNIFIYLHFAGCGWCRVLENKTLQDSDVISYFDDTFVNVSLDFLKDSIGINLKDKFDIGTAPSYLFFTPDGSLTHIGGGYLVKEAFIDLAQLAMDPETNYSFYAEKIKNGNLSPETVLKYITFKGPDKGVESLFNKMIYEYQQKPEILYSKTTLDIIAHLSMGKTNNPFYKFFDENYENFQKHSGNEATKNLYKYTWEFQINRNWFILWIPEKSRNKAKKLLAKQKHGMFQEICMFSDFKKALVFSEKRPNKRRFEMFLNKTQQYFSLYQDDWRAFCDAASHITKVHSTTKEEFLLYKAQKWVEMAIAIEENPITLYTYGRLLIELNDKALAKEKFESAINASKKKTNAENDYFRELAEKELKEMDL